MYVDVRISFPHMQAMDNITVSDIESKALDARLQITDVLRHSGVSAATFYKARRGEHDLKPLTKARLLDAIDELARM
jgi:hypothetical protein